MAVCWPRHKVALDIVDSTDNQHFGTDEQEWRVVRTTLAEMADYQGARRVMERVAQLIGSNAPRKPAWDDQALRVSRAFAAEQTA